MDNSASAHITKMLGELVNSTNEQQLISKVMEISNEIREVYQLTGKRTTCYMQIVDDKYVRIDGDPENPVSEVDESDPDFLKWMEKTREGKNSDKIVGTARKKRTKQFDKLKRDLEQHFQQKNFQQKKDTASDSGTSNIDQFITRHSRDGSTTATVSAACRNGLSRQRA